MQQQQVLNSMNASGGRQPTKMNSIQSADTMSMQAASDPSEDAAATLPSSASMQSRPGSKVTPSSWFLVPGTTHQIGVLVYHV